MVKERINEIVDFATQESPYKTSNRGWLNDFIFFQLGAQQKDPSASKEELLSVSIKWNQFIAIILFGIAFIPAILALAFTTFF